MIIVLIPAYNSEYTIAKVIIKTLAYADKVIVYDDGSTDYTYKIVTMLESNDTRIIALHEAINRGKGYALKKLF